MGGVRLLAIFVLGLLLGHQSAQGAEWRLDSKISERLAYDDNIGLTRRDAVSDFSSQTSVGADLGARSEWFELDLATKINYTAFVEETDLNSDDQRFVGQGLYRTPLTRWELGAAYERDTTRTSEVDDTGLFILENERRHAVEVWGATSYQATREDRFFLRGEYDYVTYEDDLIDFARYGGRVGWDHRLSRVDQLEVAGFATRVEADTRSNRDTNIFGSQITWATVPIEGLTTSLGLGGYYATTKFDPPSGLTGDFDDETAWGFLPSVGVSFEIDPRTTVRAEYARLVVPSGSGNVVERDRVDAGFEFRWSRQATVALDLRYQSQRAVEDTDRDGRNFVRVVPSMVWNITQDWSLRGAYRFRWQSLEGAGSDAFSNAVVLTVTYQPAKWLLND